MTKRVLVTGGSGFIGRHMPPHLEALGYEVHAVGYPAVDLLDDSSRRTLLETLRPTHLVHLAWHVPPGKYLSSTENVRWVQASLGLLMEFAAAGGQRVVTAGTCAEYSWDEGDGICREDDTPLRPSSLYGVSKDALRRMQDSMAATLGFSAAWGRVFFPYGVGEPAGRLVPSVIDSVLAGKPAQCSHGRQLRDFIYVDDVARAFAVVLDSGYEGALNIGTGQAVTIVEVARAAAEAAGRPELLELGALPSRAGEPDVLLADTAKLRRLGFMPRWSLAEGMAATVKYRVSSGTAGTLQV
jgi:nucleoside-diphosphate-sugar epimerase